MEIAGQVIATQWDHPWAYAPAWRHEVAKLTVDHNQFSYEGPHDPYIHLQIAFLRTNQKHRMALRQHQLDYDQAQGVSHERKAALHAHTIFEEGGPTRGALEALLLCPELTLARIAALMGPTPEVIKYYERLYFNIRNDNGAVLETPWLRQFFATSNQVHLDRNDWMTHWKLLAFEGGFHRLLAFWGWPKVATFDLEVEENMAVARNIFADLETRTRYGAMGNRDLVELYTSLRQSTTVLRDRGLIEAPGAGNQTILVQMLQASAPHPERVTVADIALQADELEQKLDVVKRLTSGAEGGPVVAQAQTALSTEAAKLAQALEIREIPEEVAFGDA